MTMEIVTSLAPWISAVFAVAVAVGCLVLGYWMGRNSIERPMRSINNPPLMDQGAAYDSGGDPFHEAMVDHSDDDERIATM
jgi:hypothetical protein